jgi:hypothetical protein
MTRLEIIRMAQEAGFMEAGHPMNPWSAHTDQIERFAALVAAHERERIIAANAPEIEKVNEYIKGLEDSIATVIRARGEK